MSDITAYVKGSYPQEKADLFDAFLLLENKDEITRFMKDLCTLQELEAMAERWKVCKLLEAGNLSYRQINQETGASLTTITRVARFLKHEPHQGYKTILNKKPLETELQPYQLLGCPVLLVYDNSGLQFWKNSGVRVEFHRKIESKKIAAIGVNRANDKNAHTFKGVVYVRIGSSTKRLEGQSLFDFLKNKQILCKLYCRQGKGLF